MSKLNQGKWLLVFLAVTGMFTLGFISGGDDKEIHWVSFDEAVKLNKEHPKKVFIDIYTGWCGWCKKMDASTYTDPEIIKYINKYYYAVHLDAETGDTFHFNDHKFYNPKPKTRGYTNELASSLMDGKLAYPTTVYMDEKFNRLTYLQTYMTIDELKPILEYFAEDKYKTMKFDDFKNSIGSTAGSPSNVTDK